MQNILIIGSDSTIGAHLKKDCEARGKTIYGTTRHANRCTETTFFLDLLNPNAFNIPDHIIIDTVVFCAAMSKIKECEENKALSYQINVESNLKLARYLKKKFNPFIIFLSSNAVFDGSKPFRLETEPPCPINYYGECKTEAEKKLLAITNKLAIIRLTKVLHPNHPLIKKWIIDLHDGKNIYPFSDIMLAPISLNTVTEAIQKIANLEKKGIFHASGDCDITYFELAQKIAKKTKLNSKLIVNTISGYQSISLYNSLDMRNTRTYLKLTPISINKVVDSLFD